MSFLRMNELDLSGKRVLIRADLNVYEGVSHAEYAMLPGSPEWRQVYSELAAFLAEHLTAPVPEIPAPQG